MGQQNTSPIEKPCRQQQYRPTYIYGISYLRFFLLLSLHNRLRLPALLLPLASTYIVGILLRATTSRNIKSLRYFQPPQIPNIQNDIHRDHFRSVGSAIGPCPACPLQYSAGCRYRVYTCFSSPVVVMPCASSPQFGSPLGLPEVLCAVCGFVS